MIACAIKYTNPHHCRNNNRGLTAVDHNSPLVAGTYVRFPSNKSNILFPSKHDWRERGGIPIGRLGFGIYAKPKKIFGGNTFHFQLYSVLHVFIIKNRVTHSNIAVRNWYLSCFHLHIQIQSASNWKHSQFTHLILGHRKPLKSSAKSPRRIIIIYFLEVKENLSINCTSFRRAKVDQEQQRRNCWCDRLMRPNYNVSVVQEDKSHPHQGEPIKRRYRIARQKSINSLTFTVVRNHSILYSLKNHQIRPLIMRPSFNTPISWLSELTWNKKRTKIVRKLR